MPDDEDPGIRFRRELQKELGLTHRNITLMSHSHIRTVYHLGIDENAAYALGHVLEHMVDDEKVPPSYQPEIKYLRELFRTTTRQLRTVDESWPKGIFGGEAS